MIDEETKKEVLDLINEKLNEYFKEYSFIPGSITSRLIRSIRWDKGQGGSLVLGGENDVSGVLSLLDSTGLERIEMTKDGIIVSDDSNERILLSTNGELKVSMAGYNVTTATDAQLLLSIASNIFIRLGQFAYPLHQGERQWTTLADWANIKNSTFKLDGDAFKFTQVYFEILGCVELAGRTASYRIYNVTDSAAVTNSTITTTAVSSEAEDWINAALIRSTALTFASGEKTYRLQFKNSAVGGAGDSTQFFKGVLFYAQ